MEWETGFFEWYGEYTELRFDDKEEALKKVKHLLDEGVDLKIEFESDSIIVYIKKDCLKKYRRFLFDIK